MVQHPVQLNLKYVQCQQIHCFPGRWFQGLILQIMKIFILCLIGKSPVVTCTYHPLSFPCDSLSKGRLHLLCSHSLPPGWASPKTVPQGCTNPIFPHVAALQPFVYLCAHCLEPLQPVHIFCVEWEPELNTLFRECSGKNWIDWDNGFLISASDAPVDACQHPVWFLSWRSTLFVHMQLLVFQDPQIPFHRAALQWSRSQPVLHFWIRFSQVQDLTMVFA